MVRNPDECLMLLATVEPIYRTKVVESLLAQRVIAKSQRVRDIWQASNKDWNQTLYTMTAYALGAPRNSVPAQQLSRIVSYNMCLRERSRLQSVEALLLGASGLLEGEYYDNYIVALQEEYDYLANKYSLRPMRAGEWQVVHNIPAGGPVMRLVQLAALVCKPSFSFDELIRCHTLEEIDALLGVEMSDYWQQHFTVQGAKTKVHKRIGRDKVVMMAINLVVPLQIAYADAMKDNGLKERALELLERLPAEHNRLVSKCTGAGVPCRSAYDSQALIELQNLCARGGCLECPLEKQLRKR